MRIALLRISLEYRSQVIRTEGISRMPSSPSWRVVKMEGIKSAGLKLVGKLDGEKALRISSRKQQKPEIELPAYKEALVTGLVQHAVVQREI